MVHGEQCFDVKVKILNVDMRPIMSKPVISKHIENVLFFLYFQNVLHPLLDRKKNGRF